MKKKILIIGIMLVLVIVNLTGCFDDKSENDEEEDEEEVIDTDGDGYNDNEDDFPTNPQRYLKEYFEGYPSEESEIEIGSTVPAGNTYTVTGNVESHWRVLHCEWNIQPYNESIREYFKFETTDPNGYSFYIGENLSGARSLMGTISASNAGERTFIFTYTGGEIGAPDYLPDYVTLTYDIYKAK